MKKSMLILALFLAVGISASAQKEDNYSKTLKEMFRVAGQEETYNAVITQVFAMQKQQYKDLPDEFWDEVEKEMRGGALEQLTDMLTPVYKKYLTEEELKAIIDFYKSPAGKKLAKSTPFISTEAMKIGQQWGMKIGQDVAQKMIDKGY